MQLYGLPPNYFFFYWRYKPLWVCILQPSRGAIASSRTRFLDHTQGSAAVGRIPLDEWSIRRIDLYLTTHNTHNRQTSKPWVGFEPTISAGEQPKTYALDRAATGIGSTRCYFNKSIMPEEKVQLYSTWGLKLWAHGEKLRLEYDWP